MAERELRHPPTMKGLHRQRMLGPAQPAPVLLENILQQLFTVFNRFKDGVSVLSDKTAGKRDIVLDLRTEAVQNKVVDPQTKFVVSFRICIPKLNVTGIP